LFWSLKGAIQTSAHYIILWIPFVYISRLFKKQGKVQAVGVCESGSCLYPIYRRLKIAGKCGFLKDPDMPI